MNPKKFTKALRELVESHGMTLQSSDLKNGQITAVFGIPPKQSEVEKARERYKGTHEYQSLMSKHSLSEKGIWQIRGEDSNADFGGHHYQPELGTVEGTLDQVLNHAVMLSGFWAWGGGGTITKVVPEKIKKL